MYFACLPSELLEELIYYFSIQDINYAFGANGFFDMPVFAKFLADKKLWTYLYRRDVDSSATESDYISYVNAADKLRLYQKNFLKDLANIGDRAVELYIDSGLFWEADLVEILEAAIVANRRQAVKHLFSKFELTHDSQQQILKVLNKTLKKSNDEIFSWKNDYSKDELVIDVLPLLSKPTDYQLISSFYQMSIHRRSFKLFECLVENDYPFNEDHFYTVSYTEDFDKYLEILFKKNVKLNLEKIMLIVLTVHYNEKAFDMLIEAGCQITDEHVNKCKCEDTCRTLRKERRKKQRIQ